METKTKETWIHHSFEAKLKFDPNYAYSGRRLNKPNGLFFSRGMQWKTWCTNNDWPCGDHVYQLINPEELNLIDQKEVKNYVNPPPLPIPDSIPMPFGMFGFDWDKIRDDGYDGFLVYMDRGKFNWTSIYDADTIVVWSGNPKLCKIDERHVESNDR
jgi:hypothetical protein